MNTLKFGNKGNDVRMLQQALNLIADGIFGALTEEAVKEFQARNSLKVDGIVGDKTWSVLLRNTTGVKKSKRTINEIIVHCTATPDGKAFTTSDITQWHLQKGYSDIGYHYVVYLDGSIHIGRNVDVSGAHCKGHNSHSIGVCYVGGLAKDGKTSKDTRTDAQKASLLSLLKMLKAVYPTAKIYPHSKFANKQCPCFDAEKEYKDI